MNLSPVNYQPQAIQNSFIKNNQNVNFQAKNYKPLAKVIEENKKTLSEADLNNFINKNFGIFTRKKIVKLLKGMPELLALMFAAKAALETENKNLEQENKILTARKMFLVYKLLQSNGDIALTNKEKKYIRENEKALKVSGVLQELNISCSINETNGLLTIESDSLNADNICAASEKLNQMFGNDNRIREINLFDYVETINGDFGGIHCPRPLDLRSVKTINGNLKTVESYESIIAPHLETIKGNVLIEGGDVDAENLKRIEGNFSCVSTKGSLIAPKLEYIGGNYHTDYSNASRVYADVFRSLNHICGNVYLWKSLLFCPRNISIGGYNYAKDSVRDLDAFHSYMQRIHRYDPIDYDDDWEPW